MFWGRGHSPHIHPLDTSDISSPTCTNEILAMCLLPDAVFVIVLLTFIIHVVLLSSFTVHHFCHSLLMINVDRNV